MANELIPAAQYLRMSTEHQQYSIDNQKEVIAAWSLLNGYEIVQTYEDRGRSGVTLRKRAALRQLLTDAGSAPPFRAILVYDVSRWGRFQNIDEAAHYEFMCQQAGVQVHYCAEAFINDGKMPSLIMKALMRVMAGEYSRHLSKRVRTGMKRLVELGFHVGGVAPYGYRRMLVSKEGETLGILQFGDRKGLATDRIRYVLGPADEVENVRRIYSLAQQGKFSTEICRELNAQGLLRNGTPWRPHQVSYIIRSPKFAGINTWSRETTSSVGAIRRSMPVEQWVTKPDAFPAIVDPQVFKVVQETLRQNRRNPSKEEFLQRIKQVFKREQKLSTRILKEACHGIYGTSPSMCYKRFGSLQELYARVGFSGSGNSFLGALQRKNTLKLRHKLIEEIINLFPEHFQLLPQVNKHFRKVLLVDMRLRVNLVVWSRFMKSPKRRWIVSPIVCGANEAVVVCTLDQNNTGVEGYYLLRGIRETQLKKIPEWDDLFRKALKLNSMAELYAGLRLRFRKELMPSTR